jgi:hypothetical protein
MFSPWKTRDADALRRVVQEAKGMSRWFRPRAKQWLAQDLREGREDYIGLDDMGLYVPARQAEMWDSFGARLLGHGIFRAVVAAEDPRFVVKMSMRPSDNLDEASFWEHAGPKTRALLVPVFAADPSGHWLIMERVEPLSLETKESSALQALIQRAQRVGLYDVHEGNVSSDFRILDYGEPVSSEKTPNPRKASPAKQVRILSAVTEQIKDEMQRVGWWGWTGKERVRRYDRPTAWDINDGWCEEWAGAAEAALGGEAVDLAALRYEKFGLPDGVFEDVAHTALLLRGRFYDAQDIEGVDDPRQLQLVRGVSRAQFVRASRKKGEK